MNDIHNNENISQEEEFVSPGQEKVNGKVKEVSIVKDQINIPL